MMQWNQVTPRGVIRAALFSYSFQYGFRIEIEFAIRTLQDAVE